MEDIMSLKLSLMDPELDYRDSFEDSEDFLLRDTASVTRGSISAAEDGKVLPLNWDEYTTAEGYLYYYNRQTRNCQWEFPI